MAALTVGITTARDPTCKRGVATNIAASLARNAALSARVCVVDADPHVLDVTTRLGRRGPVLEDFARPDPPTVAQLARLHSPALAFVPARGDSVARVHLAAERALPSLGAAHDVVVCDLPGGPSGPESAVGGSLELLDWLLLAVTPEPGAVAAAAHFLELFGTARARARTGPVHLAVVCTGDENSARLDVTDVERELGVPVAGRIPQLWGRAEPNLGFGPALAIPDLDDAVYDLFTSCLARRGRGDRRPVLAAV